jgi:hypothetical protein
MVFLFNWLIGIVVASLHILIRRPQGVAQKLMIFLLYQIVFTIAVSSAIGFIGHCLNYEQTARSIGWAPHRQFQFELGAFELGSAIAGFLAILIRNPLYWLGAAIAPGTMYFLAACQHMQEVVISGNYAVNNLWAGVGDFLIPLTLLVLFVWYFRLPEGNRAAGPRSPIHP